MGVHVPMRQIIRTATMQQKMLNSLYLSGEAQTLKNTFEHPTCNPVVAGIDGCKAGWICLQRDHSSTIQATLLNSIDELLMLKVRPEIVLIDIPIGLPQMGQRACDIEARKLLGARRSSIFPAPIRPVLLAQDWKEACAIRQHFEGLKMSLQSWNITSKVREVDKLLQGNAQLRSAIHETHPELAFRFWAGQPMVHSKKSIEGLRERLALIESFYGIDAFKFIRPQFTRSDVADDDILDAFAALWSAERFAQGTAQLLPDRLEADSTGITMQIVV
jgi:predicted RNase H-like nuclease